MSWQAQHSFVRGPSLPGASGLVADLESCSHCQTLKTTIAGVVHYMKREGSPETTTPPRAPGVEGYRQCDVGTVAPPCISPPPYVRIVEPAAAPPPVVKPPRGTLNVDPIPDPPAQRTLW